MKKTTLFLSLIFVFALLFRCSSNNDTNGNNTTTVIVPIAPNNLTGTVISTTQINLSWTDNSTNETGFKIERKTGTGTYTVIGNTAADLTTYNDASLIPSTAYTYRVCSYNSAGISPSYSNEVTLTTANVINLPILTTTAISSITSNTAVSGGHITSDAGSTITARGVCWSTDIDPTIDLNTKTIDGTGIGFFSSNLSGLLANTTYYIRAYATINTGTAYGNELSFTTAPAPIIPITDIDGNTYQTIQICNQVWTKTNLNVSHYKNGDIIPQVTDPTQWAALTTGAWCYYYNTSANGSTYGKLYNWYAVNDPRGLAPIGYHIPSKTEWEALTACLGGIFVAGGAMKEAGTTHWATPNTSATNSSDFTALPGGLKDYGGNGSSFGNLGFGCFFWSSTVYTYSYPLAYSIYLASDSSGLVKATDSQYYGYSVRCIRD